MRKLYIAIAVIAFIFSLISQIPAKVAWQWWGDDAAANEVYLYGIQDRLFEGSASQAFVGQLAIDKPSWTAKYLPLLLAQYRVAVRGTVDGYPLQASARLAPYGSTALYDLKAALNLKTIMPLLQLPLMPAQGLLSLDMDKIRLKGNVANFAEGKAELRNAQWLLMRPSLALGTLSAEISTENEIITAQVSSEGPLLIRGKCTLNPDGHYATDIQLRSSPGADPRLGNLLKTLGQPKDGWYLIKMQGNLPN